MYKFTSVVLFLSTLAFSQTSHAQNEIQGQPVQPTFQLSYYNLRTHGKTGHFEFYDRHEPDSYIGVWEGMSQLNASESIVTVDGLLSIILPANEPFIACISLAQPLYDTSTGEKWDDFGKHFGAESGKKISANYNPIEWESPNTNQFQHMPDADMWKSVNGDPSITSNWNTILPPLPSFLGEMPWGISTPLGPGKFFDQVKPFLPALPPSTGPGGGTLIGMNVVVQVGVLNTNGSTPAAPKFTLTNAIGIQAMAGPPIKLNAGSGGNWGPPLGSISFRVEKPNSSMTVEVPLDDGTTATVPVNIVDGQNVSLVLPRRAKSGPLVFRSSLGQVSHIEEPLAIVTHTEVQDLSLVSAPTFVTKEDQNGTRVFGTSIIGNVKQIAAEILTIPVPSDFVLYDLEVELYPLDRSKTYAGIGAPAPITVSISAVNAIPFPPPSPIVGPLPGGALLVATEKYFDLTGPVDLTLATTDPSLAGIDFLANIRVVEK